MLLLPNTRSRLHLHPRRLPLAASASGTGGAATPWLATRDLSTAAAHRCAAASQPFPAARRHTTNPHQTIKEYGTMADTDSTALLSGTAHIGAGSNDERLQITPAPTGGLALRTTGQALVISEATFRAFVHDIVRSAAGELIAHPDWCLRTEAPGGRHRSRVLWASLPGDDTCARFWTIQEPGATSQILLFAVEEEDYDRKTLRLEGQQATRLASVAGQLDRIAADTTTPFAEDEHPHWCTGTEEGNEPHRSERLAITVDDDLQGIWMYLARTKTTDALVPATTAAWLEIREDGHSNIWLLALHQLPLIRYAAAEALQWQAHPAAPDPAGAPAQQLAS
ncbi:hypothetical protein J2S43_001449 [Catenuloplanes nepalensis]|uniref:DUF317 domain-containing protein n=1 Tax=Catenuloplanes nepalensis TaxID=587533 RepID=A0ABT9MNB0_9ACTN|nr:hypothetical protein [Catenuloplanes nepalensis]MDP9792937.1 hypothetical protein [Catenuloplanes nepalensis]